MPSCTECRSDIRYGNCDCGHNEQSVEYHETRDRAGRVYRVEAVVKTFHGNAGVEVAYRTFRNLDAARSWAEPSR